MLRMSWAMSLLTLTALTCLPSYAAWKIKAPADADFYENGAPSTDKVDLGRFLFYDKILSGNKNISCATCHGPTGHSGDNLSLSLGEGGSGFGTSRSAGTAIARVGRNAQPLFNLGSKWFGKMFADGRVESDGSTFHTPDGDELPPGLDNVLAAQVLFPVQTPLEMAGQLGSNPIADAAAIGKLSGPDGVWEQLADRLRDIPEYVDLFKKAFPKDVLSASDVTFARAANAIAAFETVAYRADNSPFDTYWRGNFLAMTFPQRSGMQLFYGAAKCGTCHAGAYQNDMSFHNIGMPQIGPGKGNGPDGFDDYGRENVTKLETDRYKFKTPSLRNVELTAPYGHDGAYATLEAVINQHLDPVKSINNYNAAQAVLPSRLDLNADDLIIQNDPARRAKIFGGEPLFGGKKFKVKKLSKAQMTKIIAFLSALTDPKSRDLSNNIPPRVPSGLSIAD